MNFSQRYDNVEQLGPGLYRARHVGMNAPVLVRTEPIAAGGWSTALRVGHALSRVRHRNIMPVLEAIELEGAVGLVMRAPPDGTSLAEIIREGGLTLEEVKVLGEQILDALVAAHDHGVSHGSLQASAVLVRELPAGVEALVHDFALPSRMPKDVMVNLGDDVCAAGVLLHQLLSGVVVASSADAQAVKRTSLMGVVDWATGQDRSPPTARELLSSWKRGWMEGSSSALGSNWGSASAQSQGRGVLMVPPERFFGRERSIEMIDAWLASGVRLITVTGLGGVGKSRLVLESARRSLPQFPGGAYHCVLQDLRSKTEVWAALARAIDVATGAGEPAEQIGRALQARGRSLLVLDDAGAQFPWPDLVIDLLRRSPSAVVLCASRSRLGVRGEHVRPLGPLAPVAAAELLRARLEQVGRVDALPADLIDNVVDVLDGLPLALELFARQSRVVNPSELLVRLRDGQGIGGAGGRGRHSTLDRVFADQWSLMARPAREVLIQLAVFSDSFSIEDLLGVVEVPDGAEHAGLLSVLLDARLVVRHGDRFRLLHSLDRFLADRTESDLVIDFVRMRDRHARWYSKLGEGERLHALSSADRASLPNVLSACQWALHMQDPLLAARCGLATYWLLDQCGQALSMQGLLAHILEVPGLTLRHRGRLTVCLARLALHSGDAATARLELEAARSLASADDTVTDVDAFLGLQARLPPVQAPKVRHDSPL
jgi:predicted ATPase